MTCASCGSFALPSHFSRLTSYLISLGGGSTTFSPSLRPDTTSTFSASLKPVLMVRFSVRPSGSSTVTVAESPANVTRRSGNQGAILLRDDDVRVGGIAGPELAAVHLYQRDLH